MFAKIVEVRFGRTDISPGTMQLMGPRNKTILSCRRDIINMLPREFFKPEIEHVVQTSSSGEAALTDFVKLELVDSNARLRLGEQLHRSGWMLIHSDMTSSCGSLVFRMPGPGPFSKSESFVIEHSFRDRWYLNSCTWTK